MLSRLTLPSTLAEMGQRLRGAHGQDGSTARQGSAELATTDTRVMILAAEELWMVLFIGLLLSILMVVSEWEA